MCTLVILRRPRDDWPVLIAANRDEMKDRPAKPPARHWPDRPDVIAGLDELARGTWLGMNDNGVVAAILNRMGTLGPQTGKRSRGELPLEALDHPDAIDAARALSDLDGSAYRPFNLLVADNRDACWLANRGTGPIRAMPVPEGLHMLTAHDMDDADASMRIARYRPLFETAPHPDPETGDWSAWIALLGARADEPEGNGGREGAMSIETDFGFRTVSSSLIALPRAPRTLAEIERPMRPEWLFADGGPIPDRFFRVG